MILEYTSKPQRGGILLAVGGYGAPELPPAAGWTGYYNDGTLRSWGRRLVELRAERPTRRASQRREIGSRRGERHWPGAAALGVMPKKNLLPKSPVELVEVLFNIFPEYRLPPVSPIQGEDPSFHSVLIDFSTNCGRLVKSASERQLSVFALLINDAVENGGDLENAFSTCLLEHLHQIGALQPLRPYLSKLACQRTRA